MTEWPLPFDVRLADRHAPEHYVCPYDFPLQKDTFKILSTPPLILSEQVSGLRPSRSLKNARILTFFTLKCDILKIASLYLYSGHANKNAEYGVFRDKTRNFANVTFTPVAMKRPLPKAHIWGAPPPLRRGVSLGVLRLFGGRQPTAFLKP